MSDTQLYLMDLRAQEHQVTYSAHPEGGYAVKGLPVLKPGTYHGLAFDDQHLQEIVANFAAAKAELGYEPPVRPFHPKPGERVDVRKDLLGVLEDCYLDGSVLKADARIFDDSTVQGMQAGRYPYLSGVIGVNPQQHDGRTALRGLDFVDAPECKGLPWKLVMNSEDYPAEWQVEAPPAPAPVAVTPQPRGGEPTPMTLKERIKTLFGKGDPTEAEVLAALGEEVPEDPETVALRERAEKAERDLQAAQEREAQALQLREQEAAAARDAANQTTVTALLGERRIVPAQQEKCLAVLSALGAQEVTVQLAEGGEKAEPAADLFAAMLREGAEIGASYFTQTSTPTPGGEADKDMVARMARSQGIVPAS